MNTVPDKERRETKPQPRNSLNDKRMMAFRFTTDVVQSIKEMAARNRLTQARVLELLIERHGKTLRL
ncbi:MAG TPA: hypothetical protein VGY56_20905 [Verrucomicrobiae bacterium]|nr:hypothetical protein [Verrucomicrobiae bacterium]